MKIELTKIKYAAFASEETSCFEAVVIIDGKPAGRVSNDGHGGADRYEPWSLQETINAYAKTLPPLPSPFSDDSTPLDMNADLLIGELLDAHLAIKDLKRALKAKVLFEKEDGRLYETKRLPKGTDIAALAKTYATKQGVKAVLNLLPEQEALAVYKRAGSVRP